MERCGEEGYFFSTQLYTAPGTSFYGNIWKLENWTVPNTYSAKKSYGVFTHGLKHHWLWSDLDLSTFAFLPT